MIKLFYDCLGLEPTASQNEIRKAFRRLALIHHPDKGGSKDAYNPIRDAREVLFIEETRREYDAIYALSNLIEQIKSFDVPPAKKTHADALYNSLREATDNFFQARHSDGYSDKRREDQYKDFRAVCDDAISKARPHMTDWGDFLKKLVVSIVTLGIVPVALAVHGKVTKGTYDFSFYQSEEEKALNKKEKEIHNQLSK